MVGSIHPLRVPRLAAYGHPSRFLFVFKADTNRIQDATPGPPAGDRAINDAICASLCQLLNPADGNPSYEILNEMGLWAEFISCEEARVAYCRDGGLEVIVFAADPVLVELLKPRYSTLKYWRGVDVHGAFLAHYKLMRGALIGKVRQAAEITGQRIKARWVTGHGLGGACAQLFSYDLSSRGMSADHVVTFGQPRVGREAWRDSYDHYYRNTTRRYINQLDPVPRSPARANGFRHTVGERYINADGKISSLNTWWHRTRDVIKHEESNGAGLEAYDEISHHGIGEYLAAIEKGTR